MWRKSGQELKEIQKRRRHRGVIEKTTIQFYSPGPYHNSPWQEEEGTGTANKLLEVRCRGRTTCTWPGIVLWKQFTSVLIENIVVDGLFSSKSKLYCRIACQHNLFRLLKLGQFKKPEHIVLTCNFTIYMEWCTQKRGRCFRGKIEGHYTSLTVLK